MIILRILSYVRGIALYAVLAIAVAFGWSHFAARSICYTDNGVCVAMVDSNTNSYFFADLTFAVLAGLVGLVLGIKFGRRWWISGIRVQLSMAALAIAGSFLAMKLGEWLNPLNQISPSTAVDALTVRGTAALLVWAFAQQFAVVWVGWDAVDEKAELDAPTANLE